MRPPKRIVLRLGNKLLRAYCPEIKTDIRNIPRDGYCYQLIPAIADSMLLDFDMVVGAQTFFRAFHLDIYTDATKEKLAIFYFYHCDPSCRGHAKKWYLEIRKKQSLDATPYWNRFVEEYKKQQQQAKENACEPLITLSEPIEDALRALDKNRFNLLETAMNKVSLERRGK